MRIYKKLDFLVQILLFFIWIPLFIFSHDNMGFIYLYFVVGGWQLLSCLIHGIFPQHYYPVKARKHYLITLLIAVILGVICLAGLLNTFLYPLANLTAFPYLFASLFFTPLMALWYCYICYKEVRIYEQREWILLK
jgi:hypothetical protein